MSVLYLDHFELKADPFRVTPDIDFFFSGGRRGDILEGLVVAALHDDGIVCVIGEIGMGKTMLTRMLMERLRAHPVDTVYVPNPVFDRNEILDAIGRDLTGAPLRGNRTEMLATLETALIQRHGDGRRVVVVVDEAHTMPPGTLEEIRLLSNLETAHNKLLKIMLFGQPELDQILRSPALRQVRDRVSYRFDLQPLAPAEIASYLEFRLRKAGFNGLSLFSAEAVQRLAAACGGRTRRLNMLADKSLLAAFVANADTVELDHVERACADERPPAPAAGLPAAVPVNAAPAPAPARAGWSAWQVAAGAGAALLLGGVGGFAASQWVAQSRSPMVARSAPAAPAAQAPAPVTIGGQAAAPPAVTASAAVVVAAAPAASAPVAASDPAPPPAAVAALPAASAPAGALTPVATVAPPAVPEAAPRALASAAEITLEQRIRATEQAIRDSQGAGFTVQLIAIRAPSVAAVQSVLTQYEQLLGPDTVIWVNDRVYGGVPYHAIYAGRYATRQEALKAAAALPESIRQQKPVVRSMQKLLEEARS